MIVSTDPKNEKILRFFLTDVQWAMIIFLLFMAVQAWCASTVCFSPTETWVHPFENCTRSQCFAHQDPLPGGLSVCEVYYQGVRDTLTMKTQDVGLRCAFPNLSIDEVGVCVRLLVWCLTCGKGSKGNVFFSGADDGEGAFIFHVPGQKTEAPVRFFSTESAHRISDFCRYRAQSQGFSVRRFMCDNADKTKPFVEVYVPYDNLQKVTVNCGEQGEALAEQSPMQGSDPIDFIFALECSCKKTHSRHV